jgi:hypothetical protein
MGFWVGEKMGENGKSGGLKHGLDFVGDGGPFGLGLFVDGDEVA